MNDKIWKIKGKEEMLSDEELIFLIRNGTIGKDDLIMSIDMKDYMILKDTIYQFYLKEDE